MFHFFELLQHRKTKHYSSSFQETIDLMDNDGRLKELNTHSAEYASHYLTARNTYYLIKIESKLNISTARQESQEAN